MKKRLLILSLCLSVGACTLGLTACGHTHSYTDVVTAPTCTEQGYTTHTCECGDVKVDTYVEGLDHSFADYVSNGDATCLEDGTKTATCDRDGCTVTDTIDDVEGALGHSFTNYVSNGDATCLEDGTKTATCDRDGCTVTDTIDDVDSALGHSFTNYVSNEDATCENDGTKTAICDNDGCSVSDTIDAPNTMIDHFFSNGKCSTCNASDGLEYELSEDGEGYIILSKGTFASESLVIPRYYNNKPVIEIGRDAFKNCKSIKRAIIPDTLKNVGGEVFYECENLVYNEHDGLKYLGNEENPYFCLFGVVSEEATSVTINDTCKIIAGYSFYDCEKLATIIIPEGVKYISDAGFYKCYGLEDIAIPDSVISIGEFAFESCSKLQGISIGSGLIDNGCLGSAFAWSGINQISVSGNNNNFKVIDGNLYTKDGKTLIKYAGEKQVESFSVPSQVETIGDYAFCECNTLKNIIIGSNVKHIGEWAFYGCSLLESVEMSNGLINIDMYAFSDCISLTSVTIPDSVESIGNSAFSYCSSLTSVTIPDSVTSIGSSAFSDCDSLTSVTIGDSVTSIGNGAFYGCSSLTSIEIPNNVESIGHSAFSWCRSLTSITFNGTMEEWNALEKGSDWDYTVPATFVQCSDGKVSIS